MNHSWKRALAEIQSRSGKAEKMDLTDGRREGRVEGKRTDDRTEFEDELSII